ncbi:hypothetical protein [Leisingera thetidis]|uniref:hypothetical protein n=1 Tax=Leisingera thetidis TaxID=2930199 RepID=UPI0021F6C836|nr:hypothetical protein [Leisingera thetidis]
MATAQVPMAAASLLLTGQLSAASPKRAVLAVQPSAVGSVSAARHLPAPASKPLQVVINRPDHAMPFSPPGRSDFPLNGESQLCLGHGSDLLFQQSKSMARVSLPETMRGNRRFSLPKAG